MSDGGDSKDPKMSRQGKKRDECQAVRASSGGKSNGEWKGQGRVTQAEDQGAPDSGSASPQP